MDVITTNLLFALEMIGTVAFAFSGCMVANSKKMDIFGVWVLGTVTAVGGGAVRDVLLGTCPPYMFRNGIYVAVATGTVLFWLLLAATKGEMTVRVFAKLTKIMDISDSIGLGIFSVIGSQMAIQAGHGENRFLVIFVGVMTGVGGGLLRDVMAGTTPMIFCKRIYAIAAMSGSMVYLLLLHRIPEIGATLIGTVTVFVIRTLASKFRWDLPIYVMERDDN
ncbi:MAG: trimeric intracellular cation channel family protein [Hungatella sp.]